MQRKSPLAQPAERRAAPKPAAASHETWLALWPSKPAQAGLEPRPSFPSGDRPMFIGRGAVIPPNETLAMPWWRYRMVWLVISGPAVVVAAALATAVIAWTHIDPVLDEHVSAAARVVAAKTAVGPAEQARNHAATPAP